MDEHGVIRFMNKFPDKINPVKRLMSKKWKCSICGKIYTFNEEVINPAPCNKCDGIFFEVVRD